MNREVRLVKGGDALLVTDNDNHNMYLYDFHWFTWTELKVPVPTTETATTGDCHDSKGCGKAESFTLIQKVGLYRAQRTTIGDPLATTTIYRLPTGRILAVFEGVPETRKGMKNVDGWNITGHSLDGSFQTVQLAIDTQCPVCALVEVI